MKTFLKLFFSLAFIGGAYSGALAQERLTGAVSGNYKAGEYLVSGDVSVPRGATLSFAPGSVLRFGEYNGIEVHGRLVCNGTPQQPIVFTSSRDVPHTKTQPEAFDWNGIKVAPEAAGISLEQCTIAYSTFGLNIESNATPVSLKNVAFLHNGTSSLTREKKMIPVQETSLITVNWPETGVTTAEAAGQQGGDLAGSGENKEKQATPSLGPVPVKTEKTNGSGRGHRVRLISFGAGAAGCGILGLLFQADANNRYRDYMADHSFKIDEHNADWQSVQKAEKGRNFFYALAGACTAGCAISIWF